MVAPGKRYLISSSLVQRVEPLYNGENIEPARRLDTHLLGGLNSMLQGKVVAITGAGRGIGREIALLCAKHGASVVVNDFGVSASGDAEGTRPADDVVAEIRAAGGNAHANHGSVADPEQAASIIDD